MNWLDKIKSNGPLIKHLLSKPKILAGIAGAFIIVFMLGFDNILKEQSASLEKMDSQLEQEKKQLEQKRKLSAKYEDLNTKLGQLPIKVEQIQPGDSPNVHAVSISEKIRTLISQPQGYQVGQPLPAPHNKLELISLNVRSTSQKLNILDPSVTSLAPMIDGSVNEIKLWTFDYELESKGSYLANIDFLNELVHFEPLIIFKKLELTMDEEAEQRAKHISASLLQKLEESSQSQASPEPADTRSATEENETLEKPTQAPVSLGLETVSPSGKGPLSPNLSPSPPPLAGSPLGLSPQSTSQGDAQQIMKEAPVVMKLLFSIQLYEDGLQ